MTENVSIDIHVEVEQTIHEHGVKEEIYQQDNTDLKIADDSKSDGQHEESVQSHNKLNEEEHQYEHTSYEMLTKLEQMESQNRNYIIDKEHKVSYHHPGVFDSLKELAAAFEEMTHVNREEMAESDTEDDHCIDLKEVEEKAAQMEIDYYHLHEDKITFNSFAKGALDDSGVPEKPYRSAVKMSKHEIIDELKKRQMNLEHMMLFVDNRHGRDDRLKAVRKLIYNIEESESHLNNTNDPFTAEIKEMMYKIKRETISSLPVAIFEAEYSPEYFIATSMRSPKWGKGNLGKGKGFELLEENNRLGYKSVLDRFNAIKEHLETAAQKARKIMSDKVKFPPGSDEQTQHVLSVIDAAHASEMKNLKEIYINMVKRHQDISFLLRRATIKQHRSIRETKKEPISPSSFSESKYVELVNNLHNVDNEIREMEINIKMSKKELKSLQDVAKAAESVNDMECLDEADELKVKRRVLEQEKIRLQELKREVYETLHRVKVLKNSDDPISPYNR